MILPSTLGRALLAVAAILALPVAARADGLSENKWTGCYVGANVGYGWQSNDAFDIASDIGAGSNTGTGTIGGGQVGCDFQFANKWVVGVQGMFDWGQVSGSNIATGYPTETLGYKTQSFDTLTARLGYAVTPTTLLYVKGGAAWANIKFSDVDPVGPPPFAGSASALRSGWTLGGGVEQAIGRGFSLFADYGYMRFGGHTSTLVYNDASTYSYKYSHDLQTVLVGINYRFGGREEQPASLK